MTLPRLELTEDINNKNKNNDFIIFRNQIKSKKRKINTHTQKTISKSISKKNNRLSKTKKHKKKKKKSKSIFNIF